MLSRLRLLVFAGIGGALTGLISWAFLKALVWAGETRLEHPNLLYLLPLVGLVVAGVYFYWGDRAKGGTPAVLEQANVYTHGVGKRMAPLIFGGSIAGHVAGASVGREGAALQMAGSVTDMAAGVGRLPREDRQTLMAAALAAGWGAVFAVPFTGVAFALQVTKHRRWRVLLPAIIAAFTGQWVVAALGAEKAPRPHPNPDWTFFLPLKLVIAGLAFGLLGRLFVGTLKFIRHWMGRGFHWPPIRAVFGGLATIALVAIAGRAYLGLSLPLTAKAFLGLPTEWYVPFFKLLFTAVALGTGFVGGEVAPLFAMGATMGSAIAPWLNVDRVLLATAGSAATFSSAATVILTGVVLTVEQFGWRMLIPALIVGAAARLSAGRPGLYARH